MRGREVTSAEPQETASFHLRHMPLLAVDARQTIPDLTGTRPATAATASHSRVLPPAPLADPATADVTHLSARQRSTPSPRASMRSVIVSFYSTPTLSLVQPRDTTQSRRSRLLAFCP